MLTVCVCVCQQAIEGAHVHAPEVLGSDGCMHWGEAKLVPSRTGVCMSLCVWVCGSSVGGTTRVVSHVRRMAHACAERLAASAQVCACVSAKEPGVAMWVSLGRVDQRHCTFLTLARDHFPGPQEE